MTAVLADDFVGSTHAARCASLAAFGRWLLIVLVCLLPLPAAWAAHAELVTERAWLEDRGGMLDWETVRELPMTPYEGVLSAGYGAAPVWLRLRIDATHEAPADASRLYLRVRPLYLDDITLYDPLQQPIRRAPLGDRHPVSAQSEPTTTFLFELPIGSGPRDVWLRVQTTSTRLIYAEVLTPAELRRSEARINHFGAAYLGVLSIFFLWGLTQLLTQRDRLMLAFLAHQGGALLLGASFLGYPYLYASAYLPDGAVDRLTSTLVILASAAAVVFSHYLLNELGPARWRNRVIGLILAVSALLLVAVWQGQVIAALSTNMLMILIVPVINLVLALLSRTTGHGAATPGLSKRVVVGFFSVTLLFTLLASLPSLGWMRGQVFTLYIVFMYSLCSGVLMVLLLQYRAWQNLRRQTLALAAASEAEARAAEERAYREERERLLAMLGHELKTPLAAMRMLLADRSLPPEPSKRLAASVTDMAHVIERAVQTGQLDARRITPRNERCEPLQLVQNMCSALAESERVHIGLSDGSSPWVNTDPELFRIMVRNLLDNALRYSQPGSPVRAQLSQPDARGRWTLTVSNTVGRAGFPDPARVFEKYYRSPRASHSSGSGLGLYLVHGLAQAMGGELRHEREDNIIRFVLTLQDATTGSEK